MNLYYGKLSKDKMKRNVNYLPTTPTKRVQTVKEKKNVDPHQKIKVDVGLGVGHGHVHDPDPEIVAVEEEAREIAIGQDHGHVQEIDQGDINQEDLDQDLVQGLEIETEIEEAVEKIDRVPGPDQGIVSPKKNQRTKEQRQNNRNTLEIKDVDLLKFSRTVLKDKLTKYILSTYDD